MTATIPAMLRRRPVLCTVVFACALGFLVWGACEAARWIAWASWARRAESVAAARSSCPSPHAVFSFGYRGRTRFIEVPVDSAEAAAAGDLRTDTIFAQPPALRAAYLRTLVRSQARGATVGSIAGELRRMRLAFGLDDDEYVELIARFVQDIPYGVPRESFDLPVGVARHGRAVCADKSVLFAALLLHEGYDAGVWTLETQRHVAVGVRGVGEGFRGTGYAYIETTVRSYVGAVPAEYVGVPGDGPAPQLVRVGGERSYRADLETGFILSQLETADSVARSLAPYHRYAEVAAGKWRAVYAGLAQEQVTASRLARTLAGAADERARVYALLTR